MEKESWETEEDLVCSDFVGSFVCTRRMKTSDCFEGVFVNISDNNLNKPFVKGFMGQSLDGWIKHLINQPKSISDELRYRDCLVKALTVLCKEITENTVIDCYELDLLISENCIAGDDKMYVDAKNIGTMQRTRRLISLILYRDYKTLLTFLASLLIQNKHVVEKILREFDNCLQNNYRIPQKCTLCYLESRVDMSLVVDELLSYDEDWLPFYNKVCQTEYLGPNKELWRELIGRVGTGEKYRHISELVLKALHACGFHSDIVYMLQEDGQMNRNSFICRCSEMVRFGNFRGAVEDPLALPAEQNRTLSRQTDIPSPNSKTGMDKLRNTYNTVHNSIIYTQTTRHHDENINKDNAEKKTSEKKLFYETKGKHLNVLLKRKQDSPDKKKVQTRIEVDDEAEKSTIYGSSNSNVCEHETKLLKRCTHPYEHKMDTLKGSELSEESERKEVLRKTSREPPVSGIPLTQMDLLKVDSFRHGDEEIEDEHEWSSSVLKSIVCGNDSALKNKLLIDHPIERANCKICQHQIEVLKDILPGGENDRENCVHHMDLLKIGIKEYENDDGTGFSPSRSLKSNDKTCNSVNRLFDNASFYNQNMVRKVQDVCQYNHVKVLEAERCILNYLIVITFLICFFHYIVQMFNNLP